MIVISRKFRGSLPYTKRSIERPHHLYFYILLLKGVLFLSDRVDLKFFFIVCNRGNECCQPC